MYSSNIQCGRVYSVYIGLRYAKNKGKYGTSYALNFKDVGRGILLLACPSVHPLFVRPYKSCKQNIEGNTWVLAHEISQAVWNQCVDDLIKFWRTFINIWSNYAPISHCYFSIGKLVSKISQELLELGSLNFAGS